MVIYPESLLDK